MHPPPTVDEHHAPDRALMGPGPVDVPPRVLQAMTTPLVGYLDPSYIEVMSDIQTLLRYVFQTDNEYTFAVSGTGSAAMETAIANLVSPNDTVLVPDNGYFGERMGEMATRHGGTVQTVQAPWGEPLDPTQVANELDEHDPDVFGFVYGETSTGVLQPDVPEIVDLAHDHDALVIIDTVPTLGGVEFYTDDWDVDVVYSGAQKCLSAPPGVSPITFNDRAVERVKNRDTPVRSWYLDLEDVWEYWSDDPSYHHTGPISTNYALREALRVIAEEGLEARWARHRRVAGALVEGLEALGLDLNPDPEYWMPTLNAVQVPEGVNDGEVVAQLLDEHGVEIVGGLGALDGEIFRVGCMGYSARPSNVTQLLSALGQVLDNQGVSVDPGAGVAAATAALSK